MPPGQPVTLAVLDACVLFPALPTDLLLCLAEAECFDPVWSDDIHAEWTRNLLARPGMSIDKVSYRRSRMERAFPAANVPASAKLLAGVLASCRTDDERKDAHVIATALAAGADTIVTDNLSDLLPVLPRLTSVVRALTPDAFCAELFQRHRARFVMGARTHRASMTRPPFDPDAYLNLLVEDRFGLQQTAALLASERHEL